jgi:hypothetical protein
MDHGLVERVGSQYHLNSAARGAPEIVALGLRLPAPELAIRLVLRANEAVELAIFDPGGFVVGERGAGDGESLDRLDDALEAIRRDRADTPAVLRFQTGELARLIRTAIGLRSRVAMGEVVKGTVRRVGPVPPD